MKIVKLGFSMLCLLCIGLIYGWSVFVAPLENEFGWERSQTSLTFTISMSALCIGLLVGGQLNKKKDRPLFTLLIAGILILVGFLCTSQTSSLLGFYIFYGAFSGFGTGLVYVEVISVVSRIIPGKQGLISGLLMMSFGLGGLALGTICSAAMAAIGWRLVFKIIGVAFCALVLINGYMLRSEVGEDVASNKNEETAEKAGVSTLEMIKRSEFRVIYFWLILLSASGLAVMAHVAPCVLDMGATPAFAATITGMVSMCNGIGRVMYGAIYDRLSIEKTLILISIVFVIASGLVSIAVLTGSLILMVVGCIIIGLSFGGAPSSSSVVVMRYYGERFFSSNFGVISTQVMIASVLGPYVAGKMYTETGMYNASFYMIGAFSLLSLVVIAIFVAIVKAKNK